MNVVSREQVLASIADLLLFDIVARNSCDEALNTNFSPSIAPKNVAVICAATGITPTELHEYCDTMLNKQLEATSNPNARANLLMIRDEAMRDIIEYIERVLADNTFFFSIQAN